MPFLLIRNDITKVKADAIVNTANTELRQGSGTSRAIYLAAGEEKLERACRKIGHCDLGKAVITEGFDLPAKYIIHTVGPVWRVGPFGGDKILYSAYMEAMKLAKEYHLKSIAFPLISSGNYRYPKKRALKVAFLAISDFLMENDMLVYMVLYDRKSVSVSRKLFSSIEEYIDDHYVEMNREDYDGNRPGMSSRMPAPAAKSDIMLVQAMPPQMRGARPSGKKRRLEDIMEHMGETFSQRLLRLIDEKGYTDAQIYHRANVDRRHFSKIRNNADYTPNKKTVIAFAVALELSLDEAKDLLKSAGFAFSDSSKFDVIMSFFFENRIHDVFEINEVLFAYGQPLIGE